MTASEIEALSVIVDVATVAACASVAAALTRYLWLMRGRSGGLVGATATLCVFVLALAATRVGRFVGTQIPDLAPVHLLEALAAAVSVVLAVAVWPMVPRLVAQPTRRELAEANERLVAEREARQALVDRLRDLNGELERRVAERTRELDGTRRRFELALEGSNITVSQQDRDLRFVWIHNPPPHLAPLEIVGHLPAEVLPLSTAAFQRDVKERVIATGTAERFEVALPLGERTLWYEGRVEPVVVDGRIDGVVTVAVDITRHKDHEREAREMLRELTHRAKNLLAVVQGIARQSAADADGVAGFIAPFNARLQALSVVHELLVAGHWRGVPLAELVGRIAERADAAAAARLAVEGPALVVAPEPVQNFALALHELVGEALAAVPAGPDIRVRWQRADPDRFVFEWSRSGGEACGPDRGFPRLLLDRLFPRSIAGSAEWLTAPGERTYRIEAPLARLAAS